MVENDKLRWSETFEARADGTVEVLEMIFTCTACPTA